MKRSAHHHISPIAVACMFWIFLCIHVYIYIYTIYTIYTLSILYILYLLYLYIHLSIIIHIEATFYFRYTHIHYPSPPGRWLTASHLPGHPTACWDRCHATKVHHGTCRAQRQTNTLMDPLMVTQRAQNECSVRAGQSNTGKTW